MSKYVDLFSKDEVDAALLDADLFHHKKNAGYGWSTPENAWQRLKETSPGGWVETDLFTVEVVANTYEDKDYEQVPQGGEDFYIVLKIVNYRHLSNWRAANDNRFFKKTGHMSSYGDIEWTSGLGVVQGKVKQVTVYEWDEE